jgi:phosphoribosyl-ATP pyrophosphohydrolase
VQFDERNAPDAFDRLMQTIVARRDQPADRSYTQKLLSGGVDLVGDKIREEAAEVVDAAERIAAALAGTANPAANSAPDPSTRAGKTPGTRGHLIYEAADLVYHLWVMLALHHVDVDDVRRELDRRAGVSGLDEKASRPATINPAANKDPQ